MYAQNYLLSLARHLNIGYIDLFDQLFARMEPSDHVRMLYDATPKIAKLLNCDEDLITKTLIRCGFTIPPDSRCFSPYEWGNANVDWFDFPDLLDYCNKHTFREMYADGKEGANSIPLMYEPTLNPTSILDCVFTRDLRRERDVTVSDGTREFTITLPNLNTLESFLVYLWKQTHQTSFIWNKPFNDVYHQLGTEAVIWIEDPTDGDQKGCIPMVSAYDTVADLYTAQLNPALVELYTRKWTSISW